MKKTILAAILAAPVCLAACSDGRKSPKSTFENEYDTLSYEMGMANSIPEAEVKMTLGDPRLGSDSIYTEEFLKGVREGIEGSADKKRLAYLLGMQYGASLGMQLKQLEKSVYGKDSTQHLSRKNLYAGFLDAHHGKKSQLKIDGKPVDMMMAQQDFRMRAQRLSEAAFERDNAEVRAAAEKQMKQKAAEAGVKKLPGGTLYKVITEGTGAKPAMGQVVNVAYEGRFADGTVFDSSSQHPGEDGRTVPMMVGQMVPGFNEALAAMPVGSKWEITIPYDQAYGAQPRGPIPAFANLTFTVEIVSIQESDNKAE